jgi:hypothetical protein
MQETIAAALTAGEQPTDRAIRRPTGAVKPVAKLPQPGKAKHSKPEGGGRRKRKQKQQGQRKPRKGKGKQLESEESSKDGSSSRDDQHEADSEGGRNVEGDASQSTAVDGRDG